MKQFTLALIIWFPAFLLSQDVETVLQHPKVVDGLYVDQQGNVYTTPGGLYSGNTTVGRLATDGSYDPFFAGPFDGPIDIESDGQQLFVTNYDNGTVVAYNLSSGDTTILARGISGPAGIARTEEGLLYVSNFGGWPSPVGRQIYIISLQEGRRTLVENPALNRPQGMALDQEGNLYIANTPDGRIHKLDALSGELSLLADFDFRVGNMRFRKKDQMLYFPSQSDHRIYRLSLDGALDTLAGTGIAGGTDGMASEAQFNQPLGIAFTHSEDTLYVAESGARRLRRITGLSTVSGNGPLREQIMFRVFPNPAKPGRLLLDCSLLSPAEEVYIEAFDMRGQLAWRGSFFAGAPMPLPAWPSGAYFIRVQQGKRTATEKVVIQD